MARILIVDDQRNARLTLAMVLRRDGHGVIEAATAADALEQVGPDVDLLITDLRLGGQDGLWLLNGVKARAPELPVIIMTGFGTIEGAVQAMRAGACDYVTKPFDPAQITLAVTRALEHSALTRELRQLREAVRRRAGLERIIGASASIQQVLRVIGQVARTDSPVLLMGESGTGKELFARAIHETGDRARGPFVAINCGALPEHLQESELFGYARGAFTGATQGKRGLIEEASGGVLFLDEIGEMQPAAQVKMLRVLQDGEFRRLGETIVRHADVRVVAATNLDLPAAVRSGRFREDLFYRIHVVPIAIPPLRARPGDVPLLAHHFFDIYRARYGKPGLRLTREAVAALVRHSWPGNVRELESTIARAVTLAGTETLEPADLALPASDTPAGPLLVESERLTILRTLDLHGWHKDDAARALGISRTTLWRKVRAYDLAPPKQGPRPRH